MKFNDFCKVYWGVWSNGSQIEIEHYSDTSLLRSYLVLSPIIRVFLSTVLKDILRK